jgi:amidase
MAVHRFQPQKYYTTIGGHEPCLHIANGDTVVTSTVDTDGCDESGAKVTREGNPQTGPFYVEGAKRGGSIAVRFDQLKPNRRRGFSLATIAPHVLDPGFVKELPPVERVTWEIDPQGSFATLLSPPAALRALRLALSPMVGCFGVAPDGGQAISTETSGSHGGNMDYRGFKEGVTVYLPVYEEGALFSLGDGHALQGDGEISGMGIEISFDVRFTIRVMPGGIRWPRAESDEAILCVGNARPLDQAVQHCTTEMVRWLRDDYRLDASAAGILLGQCIQYEIGNVFDPAYTVVCKLAKKYLPSPVI